MVDRRHLEDALPRQLERRHLHDHRHRLQHEQAADDRQHDLVLHRDRDRAEHAAERQRTGVPHEDRGRRRVEPEKAEARPEHRAAQHRKFTGAGDVVDLEVVGKHGVAGEIGDHGEARGRDHDRHDGETVETIGKVHRIARADDDERAESEEEPAEVQHHVLEERNHQRGGERLASEADQRIAGGQRNQQLEQEAGAPGEPGMGLLRHLQIVVIESDDAETERHREHDPDIGIERIGPQHGRHHKSRQDHQAAHCRRALFADEMRLRPVGADRLSLALAQAEVVDDPGAEQEHEQRTRHHRAASAESDVAKDVQERLENAESRNSVGKIDQPIKHVKP